MKILKLLFMILLFSAFTQQIGMACSGSFYVAPEGWNQFILDASYNCCAGDSFIMINIDTGEEITRTIGTDGPNCNPSMAG